VESNRHQKKSKNDYEEHRKPRNFREIWRENRAWHESEEAMNMEIEKELESE
jgi:hypothetical protein